MRAEDTLQIMMDFQSDLFYTRQRCLNYLFCETENGYVWENGELVNKETNRLAKENPFSKPVGKAKQQKEIEENGIAKAKASEMEIRIKALMNPKLLETIPGKWGKIVKESSHICNYPEDIASDWLELIEECKEMLREDGIRYPKNQV